MLGSQGGVRLRLGLVSVKHNVLYDFLNNREGVSFNREEAKKLQKEMTDQLLENMEQALTKKCDVLVTPECGNYCGDPKWLHGEYQEYYEIVEQERLLLHVRKLAKRYNSYIFFAMVLKRRDKEGMYLTNSCVVIDSKGEIVDIYDKIHLAGEEKVIFRAGERIGVISTPFGKIGVCICWDMQIPETARLMTLEGARLLVCPTWGWEEIYGHARAYENGVFVASAMAVPAWGDIDAKHSSAERTPSEIIAPWGEVIIRGSRRDAGYIIGTIRLEDAEPFREARMCARKPQLYGGLS